MRISSSGNVGIGDFSSNTIGAKLEVAGNILVQNGGYIKSNGTSDINIGSTSGWVKIGGDGSWSRILASSNNLSLETMRNTDELLSKQELMQATAQVVQILLHKCS